MQERMNRSGLQVATVLDEFVSKEAIPGTEVDVEAFWKGFAEIVERFTQRNQELLARRELLQQKIDEWHKQRLGRSIDSADYKQFLEGIGYLERQGPPFQIRTQNVDEAIAKISGPQLVVPVMNERFALNATNARWGSLYDAFYGTNVIPEEHGRERGSSYNPARGELVIARTTQELDSIVPLEGVSHGDVTQYEIRKSGKGLEFIAHVGSSEHSLRKTDQFVGFQGSSGIDPKAILLSNHGLHLEIQIDRSHDIGAVHSAGVKDVVLESAITTIQDCEDSVAAVDAEDKTAVYRNWLGLMKGDLEATFEKNGKTVHRVLEDDRSYTSRTGEPLNLPGRSLLLVRNVGHLMRSDAILNRQGEEIFEGILDAVLTSLCALHDLRGTNARSNSPKGSIYIVKPKMHGSQETKFTCDLFEKVEDLLGLQRNVIKIGVMDEERRTSLNLRECIREARDRIVFINTGFLDRTGDELHTSMHAGPMVRKEPMKQESWILAYEDANVDAGLATGFPGTAQIGKGMWPKPDEMNEMLETKLGHPSAGASCAWVPSPTAATLHALHYHKVDVQSRQQELAKRHEANLDDILTIPVSRGENWSAEEIQSELDNNVQGILGYVVRWVDQGIGCSKVPDINNVGLMEDRATCRISSQHIVNWLLHGIVSKERVRESLHRMASIVDDQNAGDPSYRDMAPNFDSSIAFQAASDLIFQGLDLPNGYTEPVLHARRREAKQKHGS
ncbi:MAG: malate synthase G [Gammaproteobacteria bacterium]|nr:malate synthase G [Gammaproteobacteria bacterium]